MHNVPLILSVKNSRAKQGDIISISDTATILECIQTSNSSITCFIKFTSNISWTNSCTGGASLHETPGCAACSDLSSSSCSNQSLITLNTHAGCKVHTHLSTRNTVRVSCYRQSLLCCQTSMFKYHSDPSGYLGECLQKNWNINPFQITEIFTTHTWVHVVLK
jgi:hypothetical protein